MSDTQRMAPADEIELQTSFTDLVLDVFRLNGALLAAGDRLVADLGLTSARWQVLGAVDASPVPLPVAHLARNMGLTRQAVQRSVDEMRNDGFVRFTENLHHRRALLVVMTEKGRAAYQAALSRQERWAGALVHGLTPDAVAAAGALLRTFTVRLGHGAGTGAPASSSPARTET